MRHKTKKTKFEAFSQRFLVISMVIFVFGIIGVKSMESSYNRTAQVLEKEIKTIKSDIYIFFLLRLIFTFYIYVMGLFR